MTKIAETIAEFNAGTLSKHQYIKAMYDRHHSALFDFASHLPATDIERIEIEDEQLVMTTRLRKVRLLVPPGDMRVMPIETLNFNSYEEGEGRILDQLIPDGGVFFDVGANMGWYALNAAAAHPNVTIHCFEPLPPTYAYLKNNIKLNNAQNITAHNFGLSDQPADLTFFFDPAGSGNASSKNLSNRLDILQYKGQVRTLDSFAEEIGGTVDLIKCDVEGAELLVFKGGAKTISTNKPAVCCEILRKWSAKFDYDPNEIFSLFSGLGYRAFVVRGERLLPFEKMNEYTEETNFFFLHENRHSVEIRHLAEALRGDPALSGVQKR